MHIKTIALIYHFYKSIYIHYWEGCGEMDILIHYSFILIFIYFILLFLFSLFFLSVSGLSCSTRALLLRGASSVVVVHRHSCPLACGILVPRPGIEPVSPALEGRYFTTGPPGNSPHTLLLRVKIYMSYLERYVASK